MDAFAIPMSSRNILHESSAVDVIEELQRGAVFRMTQLYDCDVSRTLREAIVNI